MTWEISLCRVRDVTGIGVFVRAQRYGTEARVGEARDGEAPTSRPTVCAKNIQSQVGTGLYALLGLFHGEME